jgi:hypothetical protein
MALKKTGTAGSGGAFSNIKKGLESIRYDLQGLNL